MARIRAVKPEFFRHELLQDLEQQHAGKYLMLVFAGLWTQCDREGRFEWKPRTLKLDILPFLDFDMAKTLELLCEAGFIEKYVVEKDAYGAVTEWARHQIPGRDEAESAIPAPNGERTPYIRPPNQTVRAKIYQRDNYRCRYCAADLRSDQRIICLDHIVPYSERGTNSEANLVTACKRCNALKGNRNPADAGMQWPSGLGEAYVNGVATMVGPYVNGGSNGGQPPNDMEGEREKEREKEKEGKGNGDARTRAAGKHAMPEGWLPSESTIATLSREFGLRVPEDVDRYVAAFRDACNAKDYRYKDFDAAFRNCVRQDWPKFRSGARGKQSDLEARNRAVAEAWVPPEMRKANAR